MKPTKNNNGIANKVGQRVQLPSLTFFICLGISALIWCVLTFSREYEVVLDYSVECINLPEGRTKATCSDPTISLKFKAKGFIYLTPDFSQKNRNIDLDMKELSSHKGIGLNSYRFTKNELKDYIRESEYVNEYFTDVDAPYEITVYLEN